MFTNLKVIENKKILKYLKIKFKYYFPHSFRNKNIQPFMKFSLKQVYESVKLLIQNMYMTFKNYNLLKIVIKSHRIGLYKLTAWTQKIFFIYDFF